MGGGGIAMASCASATVVGVWALAVLCTGAVTEEPHDSAQLVFELAEHNASPSFLQTGESARKLKGPKDVAAAVKKHGSPEDQKTSTASKAAFDALHKRMDKMEKTLNEVHVAVSSKVKGDSKASPKVKKAEEDAKKAKEKAEECKKEAKAAEKKAKKVKRQKPRLTKQTRRSQRLRRRLKRLKRRLKKLRGLIRQTRRSQPQRRRLKRPRRRRKKPPTRLRRKKLKQRVTMRTRR